jgi:hypothetical protein
MVTAYKNPDEASQGLTASFSPANEAQKTAIANAAALVPGQNPTPSPIQVNRTIDTGATAAEKYLGEFTQPKSASQIAEEMRQSSQGTIDSINKVYDAQVASAQAGGQERLNQDNAVSVLSGLMGSTEAGRTRGATLDKNDKEVQAINNERLAKTQAIYSQISQDARDEALKQKEDATKSAEDIIARRKDAQSKAVENLKLLAQGGLVDFESFKNSPQNADVYQHALDSVGGSEQALRGLFAVNRPKDQLVGSPTRVGDHFIQAYQNPLTGKVAYDTIEVPGGMPTEYKNFEKIGDNLVAIPDGWDGDVSKLKTIYGTSSDSVQPGENPRLYGGLDSKTATAVRQRVTNFKSEPSVQNFAVVQEGRNFAGSLSNDTKNPADDQGLIYALAKALDPGSVVREGEYKTAQNYSQSWIDAYGKSVTQAINGTGFLSKQARMNIKDVIESRYKASKSSYDNVYKQYSGGIDALTGRANGTQFLTDYAIGSAGATGGSRILTKDGQTFDASDLSEEEYQQAIHDGYQAQDGPTSFNSVGGDTKQASNRPTRNNNPMNIKASAATSTYPGVVGFDPSPAADGGKFLTFASPKDGFNAAKRLITSSGYANLPVDAALRRWSNNGYGAEIAPSLKGKTIKALSPAELQSLLHAMARREGYHGALA